MDGLGFVLAGLVLAIVAVPIGVLSLRLAVGLAGLGVLTAVAPDAAEEIATGPLQGAAQTGGLGVGSGLVRSLPEDTPIPLRLELVYNYEEMLASVLGVTVIGYLFADGREPTLAIKAHDPVVVAPRAEVAATASISSAFQRDRLVLFGKYWRSKPLVFSLVPRCHGLCGRRSRRGCRS